MQLHKIEKKHEQFIQIALGISPNEFRSMSFDELDKLVDEKLMWMECDGAGNIFPGGIEEERELAADLVDVIYGPYKNQLDDTDAADGKEEIILLSKTPEDKGFVKPIPARS